MNNRVLSLIAAFAIHALIAIAFYYSFSSKFVTPPTVVGINIISLGEVAESGNASSKETSDKNSHSEKNDRGIKYHQHSQDETHAEEAHEKDKQNSESKKSSSSKAALIFNPLPKIPDDLREEAFNSYAIARFKIAKDGSAIVELIKPCSNPRLNILLLKSLRTWKFAASDRESSQEIRVNFKVE